MREKSDQAEPGPRPAKPATRSAANPVLGLQRAVGNRATQQVLARHDRTWRREPAPSPNPLPPPPPPPPGPWVNRYRWLTEGHSLPDIECKYGDYKPQVQRGQCLLTDAGDQYGTTPDGWFGDHTEELVQSYQYANGLEPTGRLDEETWISLEQAWVDKWDGIPMSDEDQTEDAVDGARVSLDAGRGLRAEHCCEMATHVCWELDRHQQLDYYHAVALHMQKKWVAAGSKYGALADHEIWGQYVELQLKRLGNGVGPMWPYPEEDPSDEDG